MIAIVCHSIDPPRTFTDSSPLPPHNAGFFCKFTPAAHVRYALIKTGNHNFFTTPDLVAYFTAGSASFARAFLHKNDFACSAAANAAADVAQHSDHFKIHGVKAGFMRHEIFCREDKDNSRANQSRQR